ncbi:hypothetical protein [Alienimonas chondri]|uniref:Uncharacterized protein n=1 Tax=Alienimonas chondri TaxID=2681879 RepID=A0ABX1V6W9_9PLAN|nr:hypothetical protein [Alienimonas chondri]NNJ24000.1 hypothetical protein [Alienimonas chondri]
MADPANPVKPAGANPEDVKRRYREFLDLLPLTLSLAGLPTSESGRYYTEEQIESRAFTIKSAWRLARQTTRECLQK